MRSTSSPCNCSERSIPDFFHFRDGNFLTSSVMIVSPVSGNRLRAHTTTGRGVVGHSTNQAGVVGESDHFDGVFGISHDPSKAGVSGHNLDSAGKDNPNGLAGRFGGNVVVTGDVQLINQDCAEDFDISCAEQIEPGTVMVIDEEGTLRRSQQAYDRRVAGVVSGAGDCSRLERLRSVGIPPVMTILRCSFIESKKSGDAG